LNISKRHQNENKVLLISAICDALRWIYVTTGCVGWLHTHAKHVRCGRYRAEMP
jgi:hypothetical protein